MTLVCNFWRCPALTSIRFIDGNYSIIRAIAGLRPTLSHRRFSRHESDADAFRKIDCELALSANTGRSSLITRRRKADGHYLESGKSGQVVRHLLR